jgi:F-type H+-transporting ATPase subunit delta
MTTPRQSRREAKQLFRFCLVDGRVDEDRARRVVKKVLQSKRRGYFAVLDHFLRLLKFDYAGRTAEVESATPLPADLQARVQARIYGAYGPGITTMFDENSKLIGGMRIKIGSDVYDGSVRFGLDALRRSLGITTNGKATA